MNSLLPTLLATLGWIGAATMLVAYILVSRGALAGDSLRYQALNMVGSILLMVNCAVTGAWPSAITNLVFLLVGVNVVLTVKRAYLAQLTRRRTEHLAAVMHLRRAAQHRTTSAAVPAHPAEITPAEAV